MIKKFILSAFAALSLLAISTFAQAAEFGSKDEAVAMVKKVQALYASKGIEGVTAAIQDKDNKDFHDRDLYAFVYGMDGVVVAHGSKPALVGKNLLETKDTDGKAYVKERVEIAKGKGSGWNDYKFPNPTTNKIEDKSSYIEKMGDKYIVGVGIYKTK